MTKRRCRQELIEKLLAGDLSDADGVDLLSHAAACRRCRQLLFMNMQLSAQEVSPIQPSEEVLGELRRRVLERISGTARRAEPQRTHASAVGAEPRRRFPSIWASRKGLALAYGSLMLLVGAAFGWAFTNWMEPVGREMLIAEIARQANENRQLADSNDSPYIFSNVSLRSINSRTVACGFDLTTHLEMTREQNDPLLREVLVQALTASPSIGERLKAISFTEGLLDEKVKQGLLFAVQHDQSQAVRLKALSVLMNQPADPEVQSLCLSVLRTDESVQMRLLAVDYLGKAEKGPAILEQLMQDDEWNDVPLRVRAAHYLR